MIYGVTPKGAFPGVSAVFDYGQQVAANQFQHITLDQVGHIPKESTLIFGAWHPDYSLYLRRHPGPRYVLWTSPPLQSELADVEFGFLEQVIGLKKKGILTDILWNDEGFAKAMGGTHLPHPFVLPTPTGVPLEEREGAALFSPAHPRKNIITQALAAKMAGLTLHLNGANQYRQALSTLGVDFVDHGWFTSRNDYLLSLEHRKVSLCCFLSESFCYSVAESLALGVPVVASPVVRRNMDLAAGYCAPDLDDPSRIAEVIRLATKYGHEEWMAKEARATIEKVAATNNEGFGDVLTLMSERV